MATTNSPRIYEQIETAADLYQPAVYQMLTFYQALELEADPLDGQFIPLTTVNYRRAADTKIFAVGILPPSGIVTGTLLDRSASIRASNTLPLPEPELESEEYPGVRQDNFLVRPNAGIVERGRLSSPFGQRQLPGEGVKAHKGCDIAAPAGAEVRAAGDGVIVSITADGVRTGYGNTIIVEHPDGRGTVYAHLQSFEGVTVGMPVKSGMVIGRVGATHKGSTGAMAPHLHFEVLANVAGGGSRERNGITLNRDNPPRLEPVGWLTSMGKTVASSKSADEAESYQPTFAGTGQPATKWQSVGSRNASEHAKTASYVAYKDLNQTDLGKRYQHAQQAQINALQAALEQMAKTPPLRLLVNPQSFSVSSEKVESSGNWGRLGPIIEHWGDQQDKIEGSGKIAAFYSMDASDSSGPGLSRTARQYSTSYQNLLSLFLIYKNNGGVWLPPDPALPAKTRDRNLAVVGSVYLYYDNILYIGSFDSLALNEAEESPYTLEFNFSFTVRAWYLLDHLDDARYTYGQPASASRLGTASQSAPPLQGGNNVQPSPKVSLPADRA